MDAVASEAFTDGHIRTFAFSLSEHVDLLRAMSKMRRNRMISRNFHMFVPSSD